MQVISMEIIDSLAITGINGVVLLFLLALFQLQTNAQMQGIIIFFIKLCQTSNFSMGISQNSKVDFIFGRVSRHCCFKSFFERYLKAI
jgi:hypothetical protein